ncbi:MAG: hypothetical protein A2Y24_01475 [Clostridiales bacterium GWE2_32_10]|nr:MAG: hypothetical protein A2Y24_01475 [Clostridiales bacterium GWE2_32_10]HBY19787.1 hypothetical protein [Clostridiales bacterium]
MQKFGKHLIVTAEEREKLYQEVWEEPVSIVSQRYEMSDVALRKHLQRLEIPLPPRGYWEKLRAGQEVKKTPLPAISNELKKQVKNYAIKYKKSIKLATDEELSNKEELYLLTDESKELIKNKCSQVEIKQQLRNLHKFITEHKEEKEYRKKRDDELTNARFNFHYKKSTDIEYRKDNPILPIRVSGKVINRAYKILDALIQTLEQLEGSVELRVDNYNSYYSTDYAKFHVLDTSFDFEFKSYDRNKENEERFVLKFTMVKGYYDKIYRTLEYRETKDKKLDTQIGKIIYDMFITAYEAECKSELSSREHNRKMNEQKRREQLEKMQKAEFEKIRELKKTVLSWSTCEKIREFIKKVEEKLVDETNEEEKEKVTRWIEWAKEKADWLDPFVKCEDKILGSNQYIFDMMDNSKIIIQDTDEDDDFFNI